MSDAQARNGDRFVSLASRSVVNQFAFANNCGVPVGVLVNCVSPEEAPVPLVERAPTRCRHCGAFMNVWCTVGVGTKAGKWKCCFCEHVNDGPPNLDVNFMELRHDAVMYVQDSPSHSSPTRQASIQQTSSSPSHPPTTTPATQPNDTSLPATSHGATPNNVSSNGVASKDVSSNDVSSNDANLPTQGGVTAPVSATSPTSPVAATSPIESPGSHIALLFDTTLDGVSLRNAQAAASGLIKELPPSTQLSIITYGASIAVFDMAAEMASATVLPGHSAPNKAQLKHGLEFISTPVAPLGQCCSSAEAVLDSLRPHAASIPNQERKRCMGSAVEVALHIIGRHKSPSYNPAIIDGQADTNEEEGHSPYSQWSADRVLVIAAGTPTYGPGTIPVDMLDTQTASSADAAMWKKSMAFFGRIGHLAWSQGISVDIFAPSCASFNVPLCLELVHTCGGEFILHNLFGPLFQLSLHTAINRKFGTNATMDLYVSRDLRVSQVMGSVGPLVDPWRARYSGNACSINNLETGRGIGVCLEVLKDLKADKIILQVVVLWTNSQGRLATRVVTTCMRVVGTVKEFVQSINPYVAGTLVAKKIILEGHKAGAAFNQRKMDELRLTCGAQLAHMARRFGTMKVQRGGFLGFGAKQIFSWPSNLLPLASILYQLQRSPILVSPLCSSLARMVLCKLFLRSSFHSAEHLVHPRLYTYSLSTRTFQEIPPVVPALSTTSVLLLDSGHTFFLYIGSNSLTSHPDSASNPPTTTTANLTSDFAPNSTARPTPNPTPTSTLNSTPDSACNPTSNSTPNPTPSSADQLATHTPPQTNPMSAETPAQDALTNGHASSSSSHSISQTATHTNDASAASDAEQSVLEDFADFVHVLSVGRFPIPDTHVIHEQDRDIWSLVLRLVPTQLDSEAEQQAQFPQYLGEGLDVVMEAEREQCGASFIGWCREQGLELLG